MLRALRTDVHQHLWPEPFLVELGRRRQPPHLLPAPQGWVVRLAGEADHPVDPPAHDPDRRAAELRVSGIDRALLAPSAPLGIETLPEDEARPLLDAWHDAVLDLGPPFAVWGSIALERPDPDDVDRLLDRGAVGLCLPAAALATPEALARHGGVLERLERRGAPLFVHPGAASAAPTPRRAASGASWWPALTDYVAQVHAAWHAWVGWGRAWHPDLTVLFALLAGGAPLHHERLAARGGPADAARDRRLFYDTSSYGPRTREAVRRAVGVDQLVHGSDRPVLDPAGACSLGRRLDAALTERNPARLLGRGAIAARRPTLVAAAA
jgi:hypothetical protein